MSTEVFLTGGSGFVGGALLSSLIEQGARVRALARSQASADRLSARGAEPVRGDLSDPRALASAMLGAQVVFHVAGINAMCLPDPAPMYAANADGPEHIVAAAHEAGARRVVVTSSAATIGEAPGSIGTEATPHEGRWLSHYARSKTQGERRALARARELGLDLVVVNPSSVQGPGRTEGTGRLLIDVVNGRLPVVVDAVVSLVDIDDCVRGHLLAAQRGEPGERYLLSGAALSVRRLLTLAGTIVPMPRRIRFLPLAAARTLALGGDLVRVVGRRRIPLCTESVRTLAHGHRYDGSKATRDLGLRYTPIEDTVRRTLTWYAEQGLVAHPPGLASSPTRMGGHDPTQEEQ